MITTGVDAAHFYGGLLIPAFMPREADRTVRILDLLGAVIERVDEIVHIADEGSINTINSRIENAEIARISIASARALNYSQAEIMLNNPHLIIE